MTYQELMALTVKKISHQRYDEIKQRWDSISKPLDGLGDFEKIIAKIYAIHDTEHIEKLKKALVIMCADHGIVEEGVSQCGQEVTYQVTKLLGENRSTASSMAGYAGVDCIPVDIGVNTQDTFPGVRDRKVRCGSRNFAKEAALTPEEALEAIYTGIEIAKECKKEGYHILATGEMGIGNTTSGTALLCALTGAKVSDVVGRGAGLSDEGLQRKQKVIEEALKKYELIPERIQNQNEDSILPEYAFRALCQVGGLDIAGMTGLFIGGSICSLPVMIDGAISAVSALLAECLVPGSVSFMIASHSGRERATGIVIKKLGLKAFLNGDMALGEGTGALMALPLLDMAHDFFLHATTFAGGGIRQYTRLSNDTGSIAD